MRASAVAVIGLGAMGLPMAQRLAATGNAVTGFDPLPERRRLARESGISAAETVAEAAADADVVLLSVRDRAQAMAALFGDGDAAQLLRDGAHVVLTSTIGAAASRELAEGLSSVGVALVDAPVSGGPRRAGEGDLLVLVGGPAEDVAAVRPVLDALASTLTVVGPRVGDGQLLKVVNQLLAGIHIAAAAEAVALGRAVGLDPAVIVGVLGVGAGSSFMLQDRGPRMVEALEGEPEVRSRVDIFVKDMSLVAALAAEVHVPTPVAAAAGQLYTLAEGLGLGAEDDSSLVKVLAAAGRKR